MGSREIERYGRSLKEIKKDDEDRFELLYANFESVSEYLSGIDDIFVSSGQVAALMAMDDFEANMMLESMVECEMLLEESDKLDIYSTAPLERENAVKEFQTALEQLDRE